MDPKAKSKKVKIDVDYLAQLSKLKLSDKEKQRLEKHLTSTLDFVANIQSFNFKDLDSVNIELVSNCMFKDGQVNPLNFDKKKLFKNARSFINNYFEVDRIL
ncbi:MAG: hypothetical protein KatS3mg091_453 [Patescibacteria group bacterium]|nr:MAG: hypothetical protein KatS3mg091_453 [Patescibacteria group bacterium]